MAKGNKGQKIGRNKRAPSNAAYKSGRGAANRTKRAVREARRQEHKRQQLLRRAMRAKPAPCRGDARKARRVGLQGYTDPWRR